MQNKVIILDCCFAGHMGESILVNNHSILGEGVTIMAASRSWVITDIDVCSFYRELLADITDRTGYLKTMYDMLFEAEEDQQGNDWKEHEAERTNDEEFPF